MALRNELSFCIRLDNVISRSVAKEVKSSPSPDEIAYAWNGQVMSTCQMSGYPSHTLVCGTDESIDGQVQVAIYLSSSRHVLSASPCRRVSQQGPLLSGRRRCLLIKAVNGRPPQQPCIRLHANDVLNVGVDEVIRAGGHHEAPGPRPSLPASAPFVDRAEFMCNTQGWIASDEMAMYTQEIQWHQMFYKFTPPVFWDPHEDEFEFPESGEIHIFNGCTTVVPILIANHWSAVEIHRGEHGTRVVFVQVLQNAFAPS